MPSPWLSAGLALGLSFVVASAWRGFALRRQWIDLPDDRRLHTLPTPRGGGLGIALAMLACAPWLGAGAAAFALGLAIVAGAGLLDDLRPLGALPKLALQGLGALPLALAWPLLPELFGPSLAVLASAFLTLALVNTWNFMDGSNGMAASQALLVGALLAWMAGPTVPAGLLALVLAAACLGFLPYNLPRGRLFLGDVGSHALGYGVAALLLMSLSSGVASAWQLLLLPSAFLLDAGLTLLARAWRRQAVWRAHREHLYQRAVAHGWSHAGICAAYAAWTAAVGATALWLAPVPSSRQAGIVVGILLLGGIIHAWAGRRWPLPGLAPDMESVR